MLSALISREQALLLEMEQYARYPDIVDQSSDGFTVGALADSLVGLIFLG